MKEYIVKPTREKGIYEVTDKTTNETVDYTASEFLDEVTYELRMEQKQREIGDSGYNRLNLNVSCGENKKFSVSYNGNSSVQFAKMGKLKGYIKDKLKTLDNSPMVKAAEKYVLSIVLLLLSFILAVFGIVGLAMQEVSKDEQAAEVIKMSNWDEFGKQIWNWFLDNPGEFFAVLRSCGVFFVIVVAVFIIISTAYNRKLTIFPLTVVKRKKKTAKSEEGIALAFLFFSATTVALGELVKKFVATLTDAEMFASIIPGFFLGLAIVLLGIIYNMNMLADFLRYISGFIKFEQRAEETVETAETNGPEPSAVSNMTL